MREVPLLRVRPLGDDQADLTCREAPPSVDLAHDEPGQHAARQRDEQQVVPVVQLALTAAEDELPVGGGVDVVLDPDRKVVEVREPAAEREP